MRFKTIMGVIDAAHGNGDLDLARGLCEAEGAHLSLIVTTVSTPPPIGESAVGSDYWLREQETQARRLAERVEAVEARLQESGISADVDTAHLERSLIGQAVGRRARYADLVLVGPAMRKDEDLADVVLEGALFDAGCPALVLPEGVAPSLKPKRVVVAWSSTLEAAHAVRQAAEFLGAAEEVRVVMVDPKANSFENGPEPGADIAAYLARHGARVTVDRLPGGGRSVEDVLCQHAGDVSAEMIVMGAYGHSRLREWIFGGVTRSMIDRPPLPLFLAR
ncbi:universal stress protein [Jiella sonneratiae]|uniref:Universal stress protein n=1 Tax=Jiella sonneratiae TaxID=2816856 RepID=A0ABS3IXT5_9HYPH|nr:universal stress protein [Jiella sonneratiae]MBO0902222.1 universal stress protein [Jiella sonneratiae]